MASNSSAPSWWLPNEPSGRFDVFYASLTIKQSTLIRHTFELPLYLFGLEWHPLQHNPRFIEFKVIKWQEFDPHKAELRGETKNLAGLFSFTVDAESGSLAAVLAAPLTEERTKAFYEAEVSLSAKLTRSDILAHFVEYAQSAAQQMAQELWAVIGGLWSPGKSSELVSLPLNNVLGSNEVSENTKSSSKAEATTTDAEVMVKEVPLGDDGLKFLAKTFSKQTTRVDAFAQAFSRKAQYIAWAFEDLDPNYAIETYPAMLERLPDDPLRGQVNAVSQLLTPDQFDLYTLQEEFNRALTMFCLKHHPTKFRKRRWEAMRATSQLYLLDDSVITIDGVSDSRTYETLIYKDGRPLVVHMVRDQESTITLDRRAQFSHRTLVARAWLLWDDSPFQDQALFERDFRDFHKRFAETKKSVEKRFLGIFKMDPHLNARLQRAFSFLDSTKDGSLDQQELKIILSRAHGREVADEEVAAALMELDPSGNGTVEPSEFVKYIQDHGGKPTSLLPIHKLEVICKAGFVARKKKKLRSPDSWPEVWIEIDPFAQVLSIHDPKAIGSYDTKFKSGLLKKTINLKERDFEKVESSSPDKFVLLQFTKRASSHVVLALDPKSFKSAFELLTKCVDRSVTFAAEASPLVHELLVEAALPALVSLPD